MRISNIRREDRDGKVRLIASVLWENAKRDPYDIYVETDKSFEEHVSVSADSFLVGCALPAMYLGEKRISIDGEVCPVLKENLNLAMAWLSHWHGRDYRPVEIEAESASHVRIPPSPRTALFLSGGVDSLFSLRRNKLVIPPDHPGSIKDCFVVYGFDIQPHEHFKQADDFFLRTQEALQEIAREAQVNLIPVRTNIRYLYSKTDFWIFWFYGAALAFIGHAFSRKISDFLISSAYDVPNVIPSGSHVNLLRGFSRTGLQFHLFGEKFTRFEKTTCLAGWPVALKNLRVCLANPENGLNCGKCEKCIRTMLHLLVLGKLKDSGPFTLNDVSTELLDTIELNESMQDEYLELPEKLKEIRRHDLYTVLMKKFKHYRRLTRREQEQDLAGVLKKIDRRLFNELFITLWRAVRKRNLRARKV